MKNVHSGKQAATQLADLEAKVDALMATQRQQQQELASLRETLAQQREAMSTSLLSSVAELPPKFEELLKSLIDSHLLNRALILGDASPEIKTAHEGDAGDRRESVSQFPPKTRAEVGDATASVVLNIGGTAKHIVSLATLTQMATSKLATTFAPLTTDYETLNHKQIYLDRNPVAFELLLNCLQEGKLIYFKDNDGSPESNREHELVWEELGHWGMLEGLISVQQSMN